MEVLLSWPPRRDVKEYCISNFLWFFLILLSNSCLIWIFRRKTKSAGRCRQQTIEKVGASVKFWAWLRRWLLEEAELGENPVGHDLAGRPIQFFSRQAGAVGQETTTKGSKNLPDFQQFVPSEKMYLGPPKVEANEAIRFKSPIHPRRSLRIMSPSWGNSEPGRFVDKKSWTGTRRFGNGKWHEQMAQMMLLVGSKWDLKLVLILSSNKKSIQFLWYYHLTYSFTDVFSGYLPFWYTHFQKGTCCHPQKPPVLLFRGLAAWCSQTPKRSWRCVFGWAVMLCQNPTSAMMNDVKYRIFWISYFKWNKWIHIDLSKWCHGRSWIFWMHTTSNW